MRRLFPISAFALLLVFPLWAQRGGGHFGGGHAGFSHGSGFAAHAAAHSSARPFSAHPGMTRGFVHGSGVAHGPYLHDRLRADRFHGRGRSFRFRNDCFGYPCRAGYGYPWWAYDPWLGDWWGDSSSYDDDYDHNRAIANEMNQQSLDEQRMLRQEQEEADGDQDLYAPRQADRPAEPHPASSRGDQIFPPTVLVFRDRHNQEIRNYAITGETLWNFTGQRTQKIPLSDLDLAATVKANDDRGVTFTVPAVSQGQ